MIVSRIPELFVGKLGGFYACNYLQEMILLGEEELS
jgi:hypothetical protein